jgi:hypothetical protein
MVKECRCDISRTVPEAKALRGSLEHIDITKYIVCNGLRE